MEKAAIALLRLGYAVEIDPRFRFTPVAPAPDRLGEEFAALGIRAADALNAPTDYEHWGAPVGGPRWPTTEDLRNLDVTPTDMTPTVWLNMTETYLNPRTRVETPADVADAGLGGLLDRLDKVVARPSAVILLDGLLPIKLGIKGKQPPKLGARQDTPPLLSAREHGWNIAQERPWMTAWREEDDGKGGRVARVLHIGIMPWLDKVRFPLAHADVPTMLNRMWFWHLCLGEPYHGEGAGLVGIAMMRDQLAPRTRRENRPYWKPNWTEPRKCVPALTGGTELPDNWHSAAEHGKRYLHQYDVVTQHLSAAGVVTLATGALHWTGKPGSAVKQNKPGYYLVTIPAMWNYAGCLPHPAGRYTPGDRVWITHPTLDLLVYCAEELEIMDAPEVHESWTADGTRVLRTWASTLASAVKVAHARMLSTPEDQVLFDTVKNVYKMARGMLEVPQSRVYRPDWAHAIIAQARTNLWRKIWAEGAGGRGDTRASGRWPVAVVADAVWYASDDPNPRAPGSWPATFRMGDGTTGGTFVDKGTKEVATDGTR